MYSTDPNHLASEGENMKILKASQIRILTIMLKTNDYLLEHDRIMIDAAAIYHTPAPAHEHTATYMAGRVAALLDVFELLHLPIPELLVDPNDVAQPADPDSIEDCLAGL